MRHPQAEYCRLIASLSTEHISRLLSFVRDWNTNAKHCKVAQTVMACIFQTISPEKLMQCENIKSVIEGTYLPGQLATDSSFFWKALGGGFLLRNVSCFGLCAMLSLSGRLDVFFC